LLWVREKILQGWGKFRECYFEPGKLKYFNTADLVPLKAGRNIGVNVITTIFLPKLKKKEDSVLLNDLKDYGCTL